MKLTNEVIHEESPGQRWRRLRYDFRQMNQERIHSQLISGQSKVSFPVTFQDGSKGLAHFTYPHQVLLEIHDMPACENLTPFPVDLFTLVPDELLDELNRHMAEAAAHSLATWSDNVGLDVEDVDGPPINDLENEAEILAAIDKMIGGSRDAPET